MADKELSFSISIEGISNEATEISKLTIQLQALKKERAELMKQASQPGHIASNEEKLKLAAYTKEIETQTSRQRELKKVIDSAPDSLSRMRVELSKLKQEYANASAAVREKMAPAVNKLNDEIKASEEAIGVHTRNVGNYKDSLVSGFDAVTGAIGGVTGQLGNLFTSFMTTGGMMGGFTAGVGLLVTAWKQAHENMELYLESADKLLYGAAGFETDVEKARKDTQKRALGQIAEGEKQIEYALRQLSLQEDLNDEQKEFLNGLKAGGEEIRKAGQELYNQVSAYDLTSKHTKNKLDWQVKYNLLLQEQERLNDERLAKETEWESLQAQLMKQRVIVTDQASTTTEQIKASLEAEIIANQLAEEKTEFVNRQITNMEAMSEMTATQEVHEEAINGLYRERESIQRQYYSNQLKINRLQGRAGKGGGEVYEGTALEDIMSAAEKSVKYMAPTGEETYPEVEAEKKKQELLDQAWEEGMQKARENYLRNKELAARQSQELIEIKLSEINAEQEIANAKISIAAGVANILYQIAGENREMQYAALIGEKATAIGQVVANVGIANAKAIAVSPLTAGQPWVTLNSVLGGITIAGIIAETARSAKEINSAYKQKQKVTGYEYGGRITDGMYVNTGGKDDTLILANKSETILTEKQVAMLGGSGVLKNIGVPGYANGGYVGQIAPSIPSAAFNMREFADLIGERMNQIEVSLNIHKVNAAQKEVQIITEAQRI